MLYTHKRVYIQLISNVHILKFSLKRALYIWQYMVDFPARVCMSARVRT